MSSKRPPPECVHVWERLLHTRPTFSETVMVSVGVSTLGCTELFPCRAGGAYSVYYCGVLLMQKLLPIIRQISGNEFVFQQDSTPAHCAHETIELLRQETHQTLFHRNSGHHSPDLNPMDYKIWATM